jgi:acyl carrier protein
MAGFEQSDTSSKVIDLIAGELNVNKQEIRQESTFNDMGADSLDMVEIIMKLEEQFGIEISDDQAERLKTVKDVVTYVQTHRTK